MNKFQNLHFKTVEEFLEHLPTNERKTVDILRQLILEIAPNCIEKISYNVPFYSLRARIFFIWPASVPWGNVKPNGVQLGFCKGYLMQDETGYLDRGNRKQVYSKTFFDSNQIETDLLRSYIFDALILDKELAK